MAKVQKYYEQKYRKDVAEMEFKYRAQEEQWRKQLEKMEVVRDSLKERIDKLTTDKNLLLDVVKDKEDEIKILKDPHAVQTFENIHSELDVYINDLGVRKQEQTLALKSLKMFMD